MSGDIQKEIAFKVTSWFETGTSNPYGVISPNFDGQGISWGPHQHNLGQGTLQPLLKEIHEKYSGTLEAAFMAVGDANRAMRTQFLELLSITDKDESVEYVDENWHVADTGRRKKLKAQWTKLFWTLGMNSNIQEIFRRDSKWIEDKAEVLAKWIAGSDPKTIRIYCLAYDIVTQNGGIGLGLRTALKLARPALKVYRDGIIRRGKFDGREWQTIVAIARATQTRITGQKRFFADVLARKLLIVDGEAKFRGGWIDVDEKFGVSDQTY